MRRGYAHPHRDLTQLQIAHAMHAQRLRHAESLAGFSDDAHALAHTQGLEGLVFQMRDLLALVVVAHPAFKAGEAAAMCVDEFGAQRAAIDRCRSKPESAHPPATGGMNTTWSPAFKGRDQSENSALTATFRCSGARVKACRTASSANNSRGVAADVVTASSRRPACSRSSAKYCTCSARGVPVVAVPRRARASSSSVGVFTLSSASVRG